jgi:hypothetical protein
MAEDRKYICSCGAEYTTSEGLRLHLNSSGHPRDGVRVVGVQTGQLYPFKRGRQSGSVNAQSAVAQGAKEVIVEGDPAAEAEETVADKKTKETKKPVMSPFAVSLYKIVPTTATIYNTPPLWTSYAVAKLRGFEGDLNEFIAMCAMQFWLDREINPFEELTVIFQEVPSSLEEKLTLAMGGAHEPADTGVAEQAAEGEETRDS